MLRERKKKVKDPWRTIQMPEVPTKMMTEEQSKEMHEATKSKSQEWRLDPVLARKTETKKTCFQST